MKQCPTCQSQYTDDTLQFCLQDGSPLQFLDDVGEPRGEQETVVSNRVSSQSGKPPVTNPTVWTPQPTTTSPAGAAPTGRTSKTTFAVLTTVFVMLLIFGLLGMGAWYYYRGAANDSNANILLAKKSPTPQTANRATTTQANTSKDSSATPPPVSNSQANTNTAPVDREQIKKDVAQQVEAWRAGTESGNVDSYIDLYADTLDYYYTKRGVSRSAVRSDKQNAFRRYSEIKMTISNLNVMPEASGERATAVFDKTWIFDGDGKFAGKVQSQMQLRKVNGQWVITGERDLRQYPAQ